MTPLNQQFAILHLTRKHIQDAGFDSNGVNDKLMKRLAHRLAHEFQQPMPGEMLSAIFDEFRIPRLPVNDDSRHALMKLHTEELTTKRVEHACIVSWDAERIESHSDKGDLTSVWNMKTKKAVHEWTPPPPQAEVISLPKQSDSPPYTGNTPQSSATAA